MPLAGVRGALRAECGVPGTGGESVGFTTPGEDEGPARAGDPLELAPCTGELIAGDDMLLVYCLLPHKRLASPLLLQTSLAPLAQKGRFWLVAIGNVKIGFLFFHFPSASQEAHLRCARCGWSFFADGRAREVQDDAWVPPRAAWWWERLEPGRQGRTELLEGPSAWSRRAGNLDCKFWPVLSIHIDRCDPNARPRLSVSLNLAVEKHA